MTDETVPPSQAALASLGLSPADLARLAPADAERVLELLRAYDETVAKENARKSFMDFTRYIWPEIEAQEFIEGPHHRRVAAALQRVVDGACKRLIVCLPPRHTKSAMVSKALPLYFFGQRPNGKVMQASNVKDLADKFGRVVRDTMRTARYRAIFPETELLSTSAAAGIWSTTRGGEYFAVGTGGAAAGRGGDLIIIDDPHKDEEGMLGIYRPEVFDFAYDWFRTTPLQRLQPNGAIIICACVEENQRVLLADGRWVPIRKVKVGDYVAGAGGVNMLDSTKGRVTAVIPQGEDDLLEITSRSCTTKVNARHPFLVVRGGLSHSARDRFDQALAREWTLEWVRAGALRPGDMVVTVKNLARSDGHRPARFQSSKQFVSSDYWLMGFLYGDGWLLNSGKRGVTGFCIAKSVYLDLNQKILNAAESLFGRRGVETPYGYYRWDYKAAGQWLEKKGFRSGAHEKRVPDWVFKLRATDKRMFLRGFFDADGYLTKPKGTQKRPDTWFVNLCNRELLDDLRLLARTCGVRTTKIDTTTRVGQPPNSPEPKAFTRYRAGFTFRHDKSELRARYSGQNSKTTSRTGIRITNGAQKFRFERVESVAPCGRGIVYDLTVETQENFIAEGFVVHNTRWSKRDLAGQVLENDHRGEWEVIEFPALLPSGAPLWPQFWAKEELEAKREDVGAIRWNAQYQQNPTAVEVAMVRQEDWQPWSDTRDAVKPLPKFEYVVQAWDTAFSAKTSANYSACTTWGVFEHRDAKTNKPRPGIMLVDAWRGRVEYPELKRHAKELYAKWEPDTLLIEARASGSPLIQDLRASGLPATDVNIARGASRTSNDKVTRVHAITDLFRSRYVWYRPGPDTNEVISEFLDFPAGASDDLVDSSTHALAFAKRLVLDYKIRAADEEEDDNATVRRAHNRYRRI